jgi:uncharacterized protein (DUF1778 family)
MDQTHFALSPEAYEEFLARLDAPPAPWERESAGAPGLDELDKPDGAA